jgi:hypothetical protein
VLHKVLHKYHPKHPKTPFYAPESTILINNMRKAEPFRNRQVTGSIPVVGSIFSIISPRFPAGFPFAGRVARPRFLVIDLPQGAPS